jgi:hypothetical protein
MGVRLRLLGGLAFKDLCPSARDPSSAYYRENKDMDLIGRRDDTKDIMKVMDLLGYKPREVFNKFNMGQRMIYYDMENKCRIDIFLDEFVMCHKFNFKENLLEGVKTLPITQLVMTKLQVVEKTDKEYLDLFAAFKDFDVIEGKKGKGILGDEIAELVSKNWGKYTTFAKSMEALKQKAETLESGDKKLIVSRIEILFSIMCSHPKSPAWRIRSTIGEKARWYELPETSDRDPMLHS